MKQYTVYNLLVERLVVAIEPAGMSIGHVLMASYDGFTMARPCE